jgi:hypothetical protein
MYTMPIICRLDGVVDKHKVTQIFQTLQAFVIFDFLVFEYLDREEPSESCKTRGCYLERLLAEQEMSCYSSS